MEAGQFLRRKEARCKIESGIKKHPVFGGMFCFLMMMTFFMDVPVFQFFFARFTQCHDLHTEM